MLNLALIFISIVSALAGLLAAYILILMYESYKSHSFFERHKEALGRDIDRENWKSIPMAPNKKLLTGHADIIVNSWKSGQTLYKYHQKLGRTMSGFYYESPVIFTTDLDLIKRVNIDDQNLNMSFVAPSKAGTFIVEDLESQNGFITARGQQYLRLRRTYESAFNVHNIKTLNVEESVEKSCNNLVEAFQARLSNANSNNSEDKTSQEAQQVEVQVDDLIRRYTIDLGLRVLFKKTNIVDFISREDRWSKMVDESMRVLCNPFLVFWGTFSILVPLFNWIFSLLQPQQAVYRKKIMDLIKESATLNEKILIKFKEENDYEHKNGQGTEDNNNNKSHVSEFKKVKNYTTKDGIKFKRNMFDIIVDAHLDKTISLSEFNSTSFFIFMALERTSSDLLTQLIINLTVYVEIQKKVRNSILSEGTNSTYLRWCILETVRLFCVPSIGSERYVEKDYKTLDGYVIPKGTLLIPAAYPIHYDKEYWGEQADQFIPERWSEEKNFHPAQFVGFGLGKRKCPGKEFAIFHIKQLIVSLLAKFEFVPTTKTEEKPKVNTPYLLLGVFEKPIYVAVKQLTSKATDF